MICHVACARRVGRASRRTNLPHASAPAPTQRGAAGGMSIAEAGLVLPRAARGPRELRAGFEPSPATPVANPYPHAPHAARLRELTNT